MWPLQRVLNQCRGSVQRKQGGDVAARETDQQLVKRAKKGDTRAFDLLVLKYQGRIAALVGRFVQDASDVEDVTQEAFIKAFRALEKFRGDSAFYTWLYRIASNTAKNYLAAKGRRPSADSSVDDAEHYNEADGLRDTETPENYLFGQELAAVVSQTLEGLPRELKTALVLREFDGLSYEEIAEVMECPVGTVRSRIFRARETLELKISQQMTGD